MHKVLPQIEIHECLFIFRFETVTYKVSIRFSVFARIYTNNNTKQIVIAY